MGSEYIRDSVHKPLAEKLLYCMCIIKRMELDAGNYKFIQQQLCDVIQDVCGFITFIPEAADAYEAECMTISPKCVSHEGMITEPIVSTVVRPGLQIDDTVILKAEVIIVDKNKINNES